jgi:osmotically-inducible protein OsmY
MGDAKVLVHSVHLSPLCPLRPLRPLPIHTFRDNPAALDFQSWKANLIFLRAFQEIKTSNRCATNVEVFEKRDHQFQASLFEAHAESTAEIEQEGKMKYLYKLAFILVFGAGMSLAQTGATSQNPPTTPPTFPSGQSGTHTTNPDQSNPSTNPDQTSPMGQTGTTSTTAITKAQSDIQTALRKQMPASADSITVSVSDDNKLQLNGTVSSDTERQQIIDVAKAAAPDQKIENKLKVSAAMPPMGGSSTSPGKTPTQTTPPPDQTTPDKPRQQPPLTLVSFQSGTQDKSSNMGQNSNQGASPQQQTPSTTESPHYPNDNTQTPKSAPSDTTAAQAGSSGSTDVQSNIQKALQQDSSLASANINVSVTKGNKVELTGTVADKEQKKAAKKIAESNAAGYKVVDHLKVAGASTKTANPPKY